jgi:hypothetical protein
MKCQESGIAKHVMEFIGERRIKVHGPNFEEYTHARAHTRGLHFKFLLLLNARTMIMCNLNLTFDPRSNMIF